MIQKPPRGMLLPVAALDLTAALNLLGRARHGSEWSGEELDASPQYQMSPDELESRARSWVEMGDAADIETPPGTHQELLEEAKRQLRDFEQNENAPRERRDATVAEIRSVLSNRTLTAQAVSVSGQIVPIPHYLWDGAYTTQVFDTGLVYLKSDKLRFDKTPDAEIGYIIIDSAALHAYIHEQPIHTSRHPATKARVGCFEWLVAEMTASPNARPKPKRDFLTEARTRFPHIRESSFNGAWKDAIEESGATAWKKGGRPKGS